ncbi:uncharacterized protein LOC115222289 [Argonauta hians]
MAVNEVSVVVLVLSIICALIPQAVCHGRLMDPPARNSMWRFGFPNPINYNDNELYCGGKMVQWARNKGKCGVCGDPWNGVRNHEVGGKYANGIISRTYTEGDNIQVAVQLTANHLGWFEFRICPIEDPDTEVTQQCLDRHILYGADGLTSRFPVAKGKSSMFFNFTVRLPVGVICEQCVFQWKYRTGNTWDKDDKTGIFCRGCGPQEEFYNCADITIEPLSSLKTKSKTIRHEDNARIVTTSQMMPIVVRTTTPVKTVRTYQTRRNDKTSRLNLFDWFTQLNFKPGKNPRKSDKNIQQNQKNMNNLQKFFLLHSKTVRPALLSPTVKPVPKLTNNGVVQTKTKTKTKKSRSDVPVDKMYVTRGRRLGKPTTILPNIKSQKKSKKISNSFPKRQQQQRFIKNRKMTSQRYEISTSSVPSPSKPCHKPKTMRKQVVASPVGRFNLGWWGGHYFKAPASSKVSPTWPVKPVLKCHALILLSGGMDDWCFVNCNANFCPSNVCQCRQELSYSPLDSSDNTHGNNRRSLSSLPSSTTTITNNSKRPSKVPRPLNNKGDNPLKRQTSHNNDVLPLRDSQYSPVQDRCKAIGIHAGNIHFDTWCNRNCFTFWCPASFCLCR